MISDKQIKKLSMGNLFFKVMNGKNVESVGLLDLYEDDELNELYKASKQLSDLCWQEIKRRREK